MNSKQRNRVRSAVSAIELFESRCLFAATLNAAIPTQDVNSTGTATINLGNYFKDPTVTGTAVVLATPEGNIPLILTDAATPRTVANFLEYVNSGEYTDTIIHRSVPGFVIQGGGYQTSGTQIQTNGTIPGEAATETLKNTTGTIAMALSTGPNSATSQWFINLADNSSELDNSSDGGPFTVFGSVAYHGMDVANAIAALPIVNDSAQSGAWNTVPVQTGTNGATVTNEPASNLVTITPTVVPGGLTYSVVSSNPGLVTANVDSAGNLTLVPGTGGGTAQIKVIATDMGGGTAESTFSAKITNSSPIVNIGGAGAKSCTYTDASGVLATVALKGSGTATLTFSGTAIEQASVGKNIINVTGTALGLATVVTSGTTSASSLSITTRGRSGAVSVGSITTDAMKSLTAPGVSLAGDFISTSSVGSVSLAAATGGTLSAVSLSNVAISGAMSDAIDLTGSGQSLKAFKAGSITGGAWTIAGPVLSVMSGTVSGWTPVFAQGLKSLSVKGSFSASVTAGSVGAFTVAGNVSNSAIDLTNSSGTTLTKLTVTAAFTNSVIHSTGNLGALNAGSLSGSEIYAGTGTLTGDLPASPADFSASSSIGSVTVKAFSDSDIAAATLGALSLGTLDTNNQGSPTGVAGESLKSLTATANKKFSLKNESTTSAVTASLSADGVTTGDFVIELFGG